jgi:alkylhydroperoxidase family enzyme
MAEKPLQSFQQVEEAILTTQGDTSSQLRSAITQYVTQVCNATAPEHTGIPLEMEAYVKKVALHAYKVTDEDIAHLQTHGVSEDAIFEITLSVALGAGMNCFEQGMAALQGAINALEEHRAD